MVTLSTLKACCAAGGCPSVAAEVEALIREMQDALHRASPIHQAAGENDACQQPLERAAVFLEGE